LGHSDDLTASPQVSNLQASMQVTGFCNTEEEAVGLQDAVPFLLEDALKKAGGDYRKVENWKPYSITDGRLITGQNPQSSKQVAERVCAALA
jgi:putative intracellular protease/amidase